MTISDRKHAIFQTDARKQLIPHLNTYVFRSIVMLMILFVGVNYFFTSYIIFFFFKRTSLFAGFFSAINTLGSKNVNMRLISECDFHFYIINNMLFSLKILRSDWSDLFFHTPMNRIFTSPRPLRSDWICVTLLTLTCNVTEKNSRFD